MLPNQWEYIKLYNLHCSKFAKPAESRNSGHYKVFIVCHNTIESYWLDMSLFQEQILPQIFISTFDEIAKLVSERVAKSTLCFRNHRNKVIFEENLIFYWNKCQKKEIARFTRQHVLIKMSQSGWFFIWYLDNSKYQRAHCCVKAMSNPVCSTK